MKIETKYDKGAKVWMIMQRGKVCVCPKCETMHQSEWKWVVDGHRPFKVVEVWAYDTARAFYESYVVGPRRREHADLTDIFPTKAKAQTECDKRNANA